MKRKRRTLKGWEFFVRWKDGSGNWISLSDLKESYPIKIMEYAINNNLQDEPAFAWWINYVKKKKERIIKKLK